MKCTYFSKVDKIKPLKGEFYLPADSVFLQIVLALSSCTVGDINISAHSFSEDSFYAIDLFRSLGVKISFCGKDRLTISSNGLGSLRKPSNVVDCGESKILFYLICGIFASYPFLSSVTLCDGLITNFEKQEIGKYLSATGINVIASDLPISIFGNEYSIPTIHVVDYNSFYLKIMLIILSLNIKGVTTIRIPFSCKDQILEGLLQYIGFDINIIEQGISKVLTINGKMDEYGKDVFITSDVFKVNCLITCALILNDSDIVIKNVYIDRDMNNLLSVFVKMGGNIEVSDLHKESGLEVANISVKSSRLIGINLDQCDFDEEDYLLLILIASFAEGKTIIQRKCNGFLTFSMKITLLKLKEAGVEICVDNEIITIVGNGDYVIKGGIEVDCGFHDQVALIFILYGFISREPVYISNYNTNLFKIFIRE